MSRVTNNHILLLAECYMGKFGVPHLVKENLYFFSCIR